MKDSVKLKLITDAQDELIELNDNLLAGEENELVDAMIVHNKTLIDLLEVLK